VYNPKETRFLAFGKEQGAKVLSGLNMLEIQAEASWKIWRK
jgi:shikimate dehydrogenase